jgi:Fur family peroxide stress response transcriptional regulator
VRSQAEPGNKVKCCFPIGAGVDKFRRGRHTEAGICYRLVRLCIRPLVNQNEIETRLGQFESLCRERGLPLTVQRREILRALLERDDHPSAEQIYDSVKDRIVGLSRTTVYRALETFVRMGVIRRLHHPGASARFDGKTVRHHHLLCRTCNRVIDVASRGLDNLRLPPRQRHGFVVEDYSVHFIGVCAECRRKIP